MESDSQGNGKEQRLDGRSRRQIQVFIVCLIISAFTWLLIKLSKDYVAEIAYPVVYIDMPAGMSMYNKADSLLYVTQKSSGYYNLMNKLFYTPQKLYIDLSTLNLKKNGKYFEATIDASELEERIGKQLNSKEKLIGISPKALFFRFESLYNKKVPVKINLNLQYEKQFGLYDRFHIFPDSVTVSGPVRQVEPITEVNTENKSVSNIKESFFMTLLLQKDHTNNNICYSQNFVHVFIPVVQYTESSLMVNVTQDSIIRDYSIKTNPEKVKVTYTVALRDSNKVNESMFKAVVRTKAAMNKSSDKLKVELERFPDFIKVIKVEPDHVEYEIFK